MTKHASILVAAVLALGACYHNYQKSLAGDVVIRIENRSAAKLDVRIHPSGTSVMGLQWGDDIPPGGEATYKIRPGSYQLDVAGSNGRSIGTPITVSGALSFVVADQQRDISPNATLLVLANPSSSGGGGGNYAGGGGDEPTAETGEAAPQCLPDGAFTEDSFACCGSSKNAPCKEGYSGCGWICCSDTSNCATD